MGGEPTDSPSACPIAHWRVGVPGAGRDLVPTFDNDGMATTGPRYPVSLAGY
jgi:hypothetical protein